MADGQRTYIRVANSVTVLSSSLETVVTATLPPGTTGTLKITFVGQVSSNPAIFASLIAKISVRNQGGTVSFAFLQTPGAEDDVSTHQLDLDDANIATGANTISFQFNPNGNTVVAMASIEGWLLEAAA